MSEGVGMHWAGIDRPRLRNCRSGGFQRHATFGTVAGAAAFDALTHRAKVCRRCNVMTVFMVFVVRRPLLVFTQKLPTAMLATKVVSLSVTLGPQYGRLIDVHLADWIFGHHEFPSGSISLQAWNGFCSVARYVTDYIGCVDYQRDAVEHDECSYPDAIRIAWRDLAQSRQQKREHRNPQDVPEA